LPHYLAATNENCFFEVDKLLWLILLHKRFILHLTMASL